MGNRLVVCFAAAFLGAAMAVSESPSDFRSELWTKQQEAMDRIDSIYLLYTSTHIDRSVDADSARVSMSQQVCEAWVEGDKYRVRSASISTVEQVPNQPLLPEYVRDRLRLVDTVVGLTTEDPGPRPGPSPFTANEGDSLVTPEATRVLVRVNGRKIERPGRPTGFGENSPKWARAHAQGWSLPLNASFHGSHMGYEDITDLRGYADDARVRAHHQVARDGDRYTISFLDRDNPETIRGYRLVDGARGYVTIGAAGGRARWSESYPKSEMWLAEGRPQEMATGIWLVPNSTYRTLSMLNRSMSRIRIVECRINEDIDDGIFDPENVSLTGLAVPTSFPGDHDRVYDTPVISWGEFNGTDESLVAPADETAVTIQAGGWPVDMELRTPAAETGSGALMRWSIVLGAVAIVATAVYWRVRAA